MSEGRMSELCFARQRATQSSSRMRYFSIEEKTCVWELLLTMADLL